MGLNERFREILLARRAVCQNSRLEAIHPSKVWGFYDGNRASYWENFKMLYQDGETFESNLIAGRQNGQRVCALDLMGAGTILRELPIDAGLAVTLADTRTQIQIDADAERGFYIVEGWGIGGEKSRDILSKHTWGNIRRWLQEMGFAGAREAFCRPIAGFNDLPRDLATFSWLLQQAYSCLDPRGGELLSSVPRRFGSPLRSWIDNVATPHNLQVIYVGDVLRLIRRADNPDQLPFEKPK